MTNHQISITKQKYNVCLIVECWDLFVSCILVIGD